MLIREVEERCGISKKNIRFYEQQGLLQPKRNASNYREYEEADLIVLKKIILLKKMLQVSLVYLVDFLDFGLTVVLLVLVHIIKLNLIYINIT